MTVSILVLSTSLNANSKSRALAKSFQSQLEEAGAVVDWLDLQEHELPFCGVEGSWDRPEIKALRGRVAACDGILVASPIYNYDLNAAAKNFIEFTGGAWTQKVVALAVSAGGLRSGMAPLGFINSLMLDFRCIVLPRYVYAVDEGYDEVGQPNQSTVQRIIDLSDELVRVTKALSA